MKKRLLIGGTILIAAVFTVFLVAKRQHVPVENSGRKAVDADVTHGGNSTPQQVRDSPRPAKGVGAVISGVENEADGETVAIQTLASDRRGPQVELRFFVREGSDLHRTRVGEVELVCDRLNWRMSFVFDADRLRLAAANEPPDAADAGRYATTLVCGEEYYTFSGGSREAFLVPEIKRGEIRVLDVVVSKRILSFGGTKPTRRITIKGSVEHTPSKELIAQYSPDGVTAKVQEDGRFVLEVRNIGGSLYIFDKVELRCIIYDGIVDAETLEYPRDADVVIATSDLQPVEITVDGDIDGLHLLEFRNNENGNVSFFAVPFDEGTRQEQKDVIRGKWWVAGEFKGEQMFLSRCIIATYAKRRQGDRLVREQTNAVRVTVCSTLQSSLNERDELRPLSVDLDAA